MRFFLAFLTVIFIAPLALADTPAKNLTFDGVTYTQRWSQGNQQEYTPAGQENLSSWNDMVTLIRYPGAKTREQTAAVANNLLAIYKQNNAQVLKVDAVPATPDKPAAYLIEVV